jgi:hypothetical protein
MNKIKKFTSSIKLCENFINKMKKNAVTLICNKKINREE